MAHLLWLLFIVLVIQKIHCETPDGIHITIINPAPDATLVTPIAVSLNLRLTHGVGAEVVRSQPSSFHMCYALDGERPRTSSIPLPTGESSWQNIPVLDDARLQPGTSHLFEAWLCNLDDETVVYGYTKHNFYIKQKLSAHILRLDQWSSQVDALLSHPETSPFYVEIGTSFFNTLAEAHTKIGEVGEKSKDDGWLGISVEPITEYLNMLPTRQGLSKVNAMVCPDDEERSIYSFQGLTELGMDTFFHGMSSSDPTHAWRAPELRQRVTLDVYRSILANRTVPCITYETLLNNFMLERGKQHHFKKHKFVLSHLKVDAEGADVGIIKAALSYAHATCQWPLRIDFEAVHAAAVQYPLGFSLSGFKTLNNENINGEYAIMPNEQVHGFIGYKSHNGYFVISFVHSLGYWILQPISAKGSLNGVIAHTKISVYSFVAPWELEAEWEYVEENSVVGNTAAVLNHVNGEQVDQLNVEAQVVVTNVKLAVDKSGTEKEKGEKSIGGLYPGAGESASLVLELEELGYSCACLEIDCYCFTSQKRIHLFNPKCMLD